MSERDILDEDLTENDPTTSENLNDKEYYKKLNQRLKEGFVEGRYAGNESTVQKGFDNGYEKGFKLCYPLHIIRGIIRAHKILHKEDESFKLLFSDLESSFESLDKKYKEEVRSCHLNTEKSLCDHNESLDLNIFQHSISDTKVEFKQLKLEWQSLKERTLILFKRYGTPEVCSHLEMLFNSSDDAKEC